MKEKVFLGLSMLVVILGSYCMMFKPILAGAGLTMTYSSMGTTVSGHITSNTTWTLPNSPYVVDGDVVVETNVFLNIEPRVTVKFASGTNLVIDGALVAEGNATHMTIFTSNATLPQMGDWGGIRFRDTSIDDSCTINWAVVEYADFGIATDSSSPTITNSRIQHNNNGVTMRAVTLQMFNDTFTNNTQGVFVDGPPYDSVHFEIHNSLFENNTVGIEGRNSISSTVIAVFNTQFSRNGVGIEGQGMGHILNIENSTFLGNQYGVRGGETMFHYGYTNAKLSTFTNNDVAIIDDGLQLLGCNVSENNQGISAYEGAWISKSIVVNNNGTGINANCVTALHSTIRGNQQNGIMPHTSSTVHFSNLYDNGPYDVYYSGSYGTDVNATSNWWGTTNTTEISQHIYDYHDDYNVGKVFYEPFLDSEIAIPPLSHDLAIISVTVSPASLQQYDYVHLTVTILNEGDFDETWNLTVYVGSYPILNGTGSCGIGQNTTPNSDWYWYPYLGGVPAGNYTVRAEITAVPGETDTADNTYVDGQIELIGPPPPPPQPPNAYFSYSPSHPSVGESVTFDTSSSWDPDGSIVDYIWNYGDNTTGRGNVTTHAYNAQGTYAVILRVVDNDGLNGTSIQYLTVLPPMLVHDIAVIGVKASPARVVPGDPVTIAVTAVNHGDFNETFAVTTFYDDAAAAPAQTVTKLPPKTNLTLNFVWNTSGIPEGEYVIKAQASVVPEEGNTGDNTLSDGKVVLAYRRLTVALSGDFDYLLREAVKVKIAALVKDANTSEIVSGANVTIRVYDDANLLWVSSVMKENPANSGVYQWTSKRTIQNLNLDKGVYLVLVEASHRGGPATQETMLFHIDPPGEESPETLQYLLFTTLVLCGTAVIVAFRKQIAQVSTKLHNSARTKR